MSKGIFMKLRIPTTVSMNVLAVFSIMWLMALGFVAIAWYIDYNRANETQLIVDKAIATAIESHSRANTLQRQLDQLMP